jgi:TetR/AcrR family transcriptional regulator, transcriptional repressor for nem operon
MTAPNRPVSEIPATRDRLINTAAHLLWHRSYAATGVDDICRLAAAQKGSFYHFFKSKADLAITAVEHQWTTTRQEVFEPLTTTGQPGLDRFRRLLDRLSAIQQDALAEAGALPGSRFGSLGQEMAHQDDRIRVAVHAVFEAHCQFLQAWLDEAVRARQVVPGDTALRARQIFALIEGALLVAKVAADPTAFSALCAAWPALAGQPGLPAPRPSSAIPELV